MGYGNRDMCSLLRPIKLKLSFWRVREWSKPNHEFSHLVSNIFLFSSWYFLSEVDYSKL